MKTLATFFITSIIVAALWFMQTEEETVVAQETENTPPPNLVPVKTAEVVSDIVVPLLWVPGTVMSRNDADITSEISGRITWIAEVGTLVTQGEVIVKLDDYQLQLELKQADVTINRIQTELEYTDKNLTRLQRLAKQNNAAADQLDQASSDAEIKKQELIQAKVAKKQVLHRISQANITAPFTGTIVDRAGHVGEYINQSGLLLRLVDTESIEVSARAPIDIASHISQNNMVAIKHDNQEKSFPVRSVIKVGDQISRMIEIRINVSDSDWLVGDAVRVALPKDKGKKVLGVPRDALVFRKNESYVFKLNEKNEATRVLVNTGIGYREFIEILSTELVPGDKVVIRGAERLSEGQVVKILGS